MEDILLCKTYDGLHKNIIIGLTGRTGAGCSTAADILATEDFNGLDLHTPLSDEKCTAEDRKYDILYHYFGENGNKWIPFKIIKVSNIILKLILENGCEALVDFLRNAETINIEIDKKDELIRDFEAVGDLFDAAQTNKKLLEKPLWDLNEDELSRAEDFYFVRLPQYRKIFKDITKNHACREVSVSKSGGKQQRNNDLFKILLQYIGNNIRASGNPYSSEFCKENEKLYTEINQWIQLIMRRDAIKQKRTRICIDALRNPFEYLYLKNNYPGFYMIAINTVEDTRISRLEKLNYKHEEIASLDLIEFPETLKDNQLFYHQDIKSCVEKADIHIDNSPDEQHKFNLTQQILRYVVLMNHPGLVTPTAVERCMQIAYNARLNSGCLSRQVGAVITDETYSIKAVGWNEVPAGQLSCSLRDIRKYKNKDVEAFSQYELQNKDFEATVCKLCERKASKRLFGLPLPYCFKDIKMGLDNQRNQVHTRSLHAEENAFLQIVKYGGEGIRGGKLFVTASPCELCSKKSYQLGIREIYYIISYPGISREHILNFGRTNNPQLKLYNGAIGEAYEKLYSRVIPYKDELELLTGINDRTVASNLYLDERIMGSMKYIVPLRQDIQLIFEKKNEVVCVRKTAYKVVDSSVKKIYFGFNWTGNMVGDITPLSDNIQVSLAGNEQYNRTVELELLREYKEGDELNIAIKVDLRNDKLDMKPFLSYTVKNPLDELTLSVKVKKGVFVPCNVVLNRYYDFVNDRKLGAGDSLGVEDKGEYWEMTFSTGDKNEIPIVKYVYALEWDEKEIESF